MGFYSPYAKFIRFLFRATRPKWRAEYVEPLDTPVVYMIHHQNMFGPIHAIGILPDESHMWSLHVFTKRMSCFKQYFHYTYLERYGWPRPKAYLMARLLSFLVPGILNAFQVIPVYHERESMITMRRSLKALQKGENLAICADVDYASRSPEVGELYTGFMLIGSMYRHATGKDLPFVPLYTSKLQKKVVVGTPLFLPSDQPMNEDIANAFAEKIRNSINALGRQCGDIPLDNAEGEPA